MKNLLIFVFIVFFFQIVSAGSLSRQLSHEIPDPVINGEIAHLELRILDRQERLYNATLLYRGQGEHEFSSVKLKNDGFSLYADLPTEKIQSGAVEYYFAFEDASGEVLSLPEYTPDVNPFRMEIAPQEAQQTGPASTPYELLLLSPEPFEAVSEDEFMIAVSIPFDPDLVDFTRTRLLIDGINVSTLLIREENLYTFLPKSIRSGPHDAEFKVYDQNGNLLAQKNWSFKINETITGQTGFTSQTNIFIDNRYQNISESSDNFFRGGFDFNGSYNAFDIGASGLMSSEESYNSQAENRFGIRLRYNFWENSNIYLKGGDFTAYYDPLAFWDRRVLGLGMGVNLKYFNLDISVGQTARAVEGVYNSDEDRISRYGSYEQSFFSIRPEFKFGSHVSWGLDLVNGKDDPNSIKYGANPREALALGTTLNLDFDGHRIQFMGSLHASIINNDASTEVDFDTLADRYDLTGSEKDLAESFVNFMEKTGFLTISQGLAPIPSVAMQFETRLNYFRHNLKLTYKNIDPDYTTPGNPYLLRGVRGIFINDNVRLLSNQVYLNIYFKAYDDNLDQDNAQTSNTDVGGAISYFPMQNLPSVTLSYGNQSRKNDLNPLTSDSLLFPEDNSTQRIGLSSSYKFKTGSVENTATFSASNFLRDDAATETNQSEFTLYSIGIRNKFSFPLTTQFSYSQSSSIFGKNDTERNTDINKIFIGLDYNLINAVMESDLRPFLNVTLQDISTSSSAQDENYNRINYTTGLTLRNLTYGNLSLRYDYIDYGDNADWSDSILSTRYEINF